MERKNQEKFTFALIPKLTKNPFFTVAQEGCVDKSFELENVECLYIGPENENQIEQNAIIRQLIADKSVQGISVSVSDAALAVDAIDEAIEAGIPVITFDSDCPGSNRFSYIGTDNYAFGELLAKALLLVDPDGGEYGKFGFVSGAGPNLAERVRGFRDALESIDAFKSKWTEVEASPTDCEDKIDLALEQCADYAKDPEIRAIVPVGGWPMWNPQGWISFIETYRSQKNLTLVVADALDIQVELINMGKGDGLIGQLPYEMGQISIQTLFNINNGITTQQEITGTNLLQVLSVPLNLPAVNVDNNYISNLRYTGYTLYGILAFISISAAIFVFNYRRSKVMSAGPLPLLLRICLGTAISGAYIVTSSIDDELFGEKTCDLACNLGPWLLMIGFSIYFSALFTKSWSIYDFLQNPSDNRKIRIQKLHKLVPFFILTGVNFILLLSMTIVSPRRYVRIPSSDLDSWNRVIRSAGHCTGQNDVAFFSIMVVANFCFIAIANYHSIKGQAVRTEFYESQYISLAEAAIMQAMVIGSALIPLTMSQPRANYLATAMLLFLAIMAVLLLIFLPKIIYAKSPKQPMKSYRKSNVPITRTKSFASSISANAEGLRMSFDKTISARFVSSESSENQHMRDE